MIPEDDYSMQPLIVPGKLDSLEEIRRFILAVANSAGLEKARAYRLSLAVDEIATNIVNYGYSQAGMVGDISIEVELADESLTVTLDDTAAHYDPTLKTPPPAQDFTQPLSDRLIGGWGVYLAIQGVDQFRYQRLNGHNRNTFIMYRSSK